MSEFGVQQLVNFKNSKNNRDLISVTFNKSRPLSRACVLQSEKNCSNLACIEFFWGMPPIGAFIPNSVRCIGYR